MGRGRPQNSRNAPGHKAGGDRRSGNKETRKLGTPWLVFRPRAGDNADFLLGRRVEGRTGTFIHVHLLDILDMTNDGGYVLREEVVEFLPKDVLLRDVVVQDTPGGFWFSEEQRSRILQGFCRFFPCRQASPNCSRPNVTDHASPAAGARVGEWLSFWQRTGRRWHG